MDKQERENYIIERVERIREDKKLSRYRMSKQAGLSQSSISNLLNRKNTPSIATLEKICNGLNITLAQFFSYDEEYPNLSDEQKAWLDMHNQLTEEERLRVEAYIQGILSTRK